MNTVIHKLKGDRVIWMTVLFLGLISLLAVYSSISSLAFKHEGGSTMHYLMKHGIMLITGGAIMYFVSKQQFRISPRLSQLLIGVMAVLLLLTLLLGSNINDASRWITIPIINQSFQTSDPAKVVLIVYLARVLGKHHGQEWSLRDVLVKLMVPVGAICGLILPANFSTAAVLFTVCLVIMFIGQVPLKHMVVIMGAAIGVFILLLVLAKSTPGLLPRLDTWVGRIESFGVEDHDANYQVEHAKIAIASGGFLPNGPGSGQSRNFLPHPYSDMIYEFIIEEYGSILGGLGLLLLYLILLFRAVRVASGCQKPFGALAAIGLGLMLVLQAMINMAVAVNLVPVTGQPLPLVSMGGTSVWFTCLAIGIMLSVSRGNEEQAPANNDVQRPRTAFA